MSTHPTEAKPQPRRGSRVLWSLLTAFALIGSGAALAFAVPQDDPPPPVGDDPPPKKDRGFFGGEQEKGELARRARNLLVERLPAPRAPLVRVGRYWINLDRVAYVEQRDRDVLVRFDGGTAVELEGEAGEELIARLGQPSGPGFGPGGPGGPGGFDGPPGGERFEDVKKARVRGREREPETKDEGEPVKRERQRVREVEKEEDPDEDPKAERVRF